MPFAAGINSVSGAGAAFQSSSHTLRQCDTAVSLGDLEARSWALVGVWAVYLTEG